MMVNSDKKNLLNMIRYSCVQLLRYVIKNDYKNVKFASSGITKSGFYCDLDSNYSFKTKDLKIIQKKMLEKVSEKYDIFHTVINKNIFIKDLFKKKEFYQIDILKNSLNFQDNINVCYHKKYLDFSLGKQVSNIKFCKYIILQKISGVYWKNNNKNKMLQRIFGIAWSTKNQLEEYLLKIKNLKNLDHRKLSKKLDFYHVQEDSPGMIFWHHNGYIIFRQLEKFIRYKLKEYKYQEVKTPLIIDQSLWKKSGHWNFYKNSMFLTESENRLYCIKPMNCPAHVSIFKNSLKSYRDLPIRISEFGSCHRNEPSGSLHGLMRARSFTQDDAHIFCTEKQVKSELNLCMHMLLELYKTFGFKKITVIFSTRPKNRIGNEKIWDIAEQDLKSILVKNNISFTYGKGEGAFYGPKIEISLEDSFNRVWQCGTIQLDFYLSSRLNAYYIDKNNLKKFPVVIHRALLGSLERFIGILLENYSGKLPFWLSPIQVVVLSISEKHADFVNKITKKLLNFNIRVISDIQNSSISFKIRQYISKFIPYLLICGDKEIKNNLISVRSRSKNISLQLKIEDFIDKILKKNNFFSNN